MQIIFRGEAAVAALGDLAMNSDVFPLSDGTVGVAIPTKIVDSVGEDTVMGALARVEYFDLYSGEWKRPNKSVQTTAMTPPPSATPLAPLSDL